ncbi:hypothetical protein UY3_02786 [Chelonia mydas]|uniref:Uncharacterized protein n=1 Tax=Chelonia mydas TaxID=8469 RepID=M7BPY2_CHEMY|nr:hypothetical protein UY3_02786 [Chelonia mydas]
MPTAAPTSCRFYKELDAILGGDPTSTAKAPVDTSVARVPVKSGLKRYSPGTVISPAPAVTHHFGGLVAHVCLPGVSQLVTELTLGAQPPSLLSPAERVHRIRKRPRRTKEDFLREVTTHSAAKKQELKEWPDSKKRDRKENTAHQNGATERLLKVMERQADVLQELLALQTEQLRTCPPLQPLSQNSFPCAPQTPPTHSYQPSGCSLYPPYSTPAPSQSSPADAQDPVHSTPIPLQFGPAVLQYPLHCTPKEKAGYDTWTYTNL